MLPPAIFDTALHFHIVNVCTPSQHSIDSVGFSTFANNSIGFATFTKKFPKMERICCVAITLRACLSFYLDFYLSCNDRFLFTCAKDSFFFFIHSVFFFRFCFVFLSVLPSFSLCFFFILCIFFKYKSVCSQSYLT